MSKTIVGAVKIRGLPELSTFESVEQFVRELPNLLQIEIEDSGISNVIISNEQPGADDKGSLWVRRDNSGAIIGIYIFSTDKWIQILPAPSQLLILMGNSDNPDPGYRKLEAGDFNLTQEEVDGFYTQYGVEIGSSGVYSVYPGIFIGL